MTDDHAPPDDLAVRRLPVAAARGRLRPRPAGRLSPGPGERPAVPGRDPGARGRQAIPCARPRGAAAAPGVQLQPWAQLVRCDPDHHPRRLQGRPRLRQLRLHPQPATAVVRLRGLQPLPQGRGPGAAVRRALPQPEPGTAGPGPGSLYRRAAGPGPDRTGAGAETLLPRAVPAQPAPVRARQRHPHRHPGDPGPLQPGPGPGNRGAGQPGCRPARAGAAGRGAAGDRRPGAARRTLPGAPAEPRQLHRLARPGAGRESRAGLAAPRGGRGPLRGRAEPPTSCRAWACTPAPASPSPVRRTPTTSATRPTASASS